MEKELQQEIQQASVRDLLRTRQVLLELGDEDESFIVELERECVKRWCDAAGIERKAGA